MVWTWVVVLEVGFLTHSEGRADRNCLCFGCGLRENAEESRSLTELLAPTILLRESPGPYCRESGPKEIFGNTSALETTPV